MLNTIFRDNHIAKRLDIYAHLLGISDVLWEHVTVPNTCALNKCEACAEHPKYSDYEGYQKDERRRYFARSEASNKRIFKGSDTKVQYCDRQTIQMRIALQAIPA